MNEWLKQILIVAVLALIFVTGGWMMGVHSQDQKIVMMANDFVNRTCSANKPLIGDTFSHTFRIENGTIVFEEP